MSEELLALRRVTKKYGRHTILTDITLSIKRGETIMIRGGNGSGKSTLLRMVCGLLPVSSGERVVHATKLKLGYAPDRLPQLRMTSTEYLTHMGRISQIPKQQLQSKISELHAFYRLQPTSLKMIHYSKGMLQKVNMMQATLLTPDLLVLDEPFSGLDSESSEHLLDSIQQLKAQGTSILAAVHAPLLRKKLEDCTYWIDQGILRKDDIVGAHVYELVCGPEQGALKNLMNMYPHMSWQINNKGHASVTFTQSDYRIMMQKLLNEGIEIISLQRMEERP